MAGEIGGAQDAPAYVLNATADTTGFGDLSAWTTDPVGAHVAHGWLYGRGSADSKAGIAIFCHLVASFRSRRFARRLGFVFDADEHNGLFSGMRSFLDRSDRPIAGVLIGYPGADRIGAGARGFWRATLEIAGVMAHSGSSRDSGTNAVAKAAQLVVWLAEWQERLAREISDDFPLPPKATVTRIDGGGEFSVVPDRCEIGLDVRLTFSFAADAAEAQVRALVDRLDAQHPCPSRSRVVAQSFLPAYRLQADLPIAAALSRAGERVLRRPLPFVVTGPSNDGNLLAERGIPATCGFGAAYRNIHAPDECVDLSSLAPAFRVYEAALEELLKTERTAE